MPPAITNPLVQFLTGPYAALAIGMVTLVLCLFGAPICEALGLMDHPDGDRKNHDEPTPMIGGIAILVPMVCWCGLLAVVLLPADAKFPLAVAIAAGGAGLVGFTDDQSETSPESRILLLLFFGVVALAIEPGLVTHQIYWGVAPPMVIPAWAAWMLALLSLIGLSSAVNMADGIHGLSLFLYLTWAVCLAAIGPHIVATLSVVAVVTVLVALLFNFRGGIFIGDCGTYGITFLIGLLAIEAQNSGRLPLPTIAAWFCIPVLDCFRLIIERLAGGKAPWRGDYNHLHHRLAAKFGQRRALTGYAALVAISAALSSALPSSALPLLGVEMLVYASAIAITNAPRSSVDEHAVAKAIKSSPNVVEIGTKPEKTA
jgi:UDP-GlcNAc:undecaprenyl-phosphate GlcNAc-1-phosphate transferase